MNVTSEEISSRVKELAGRLGFFQTGIARAGRLDDEAARLETWLLQGYHAGMQYMENHYEKRIDPVQLIENARSVITFLYNYYPHNWMPEDNFRLSCYAYGRDYHKVIRKKLREIAGVLMEEYGSLHCRGFVDSAPVLERAWAVRAGLGWVGKNTCLIHPRSGSYFFIAEIITDLEMAYDKPWLRNLCGKCTRCMDMCPSSAIIAPYVLDAQKCISYQTIENKGEIPENLHGKMQGMVFGCDICQQVCPWNSFASPHNEPEFLPREGLFELKAEQWEDLDGATYDKLLRGTPVDRIKLEGLRRNIAFVKKEKPDQGKSDPAPGPD